MDYYGWDYGPDYALGLLATFVVFFAAVFFAGLIVKFVLYIFRSVGVYNLAKNMGHRNPWMAWVPFANWYILGEVADNCEAAQKGVQGYYRYILLIGSILSSGVWCIFTLPGLVGFMSQMEDLSYGYSYGAPLAGISSMGLFGVTPIISLLFFIFTMVVLYKIFNSYKPESATLWTVLCVIFPMLRDIFLFAVRNNVPVHARPGNGYGSNPNFYPNQNGYSQPDAPSNPGAYSGPDQDWQQQDNGFQNSNNDLDR